ncbi:Dihydrolipoyllysine-residue acetyltransferase component of pyruvate dehydrogenase complex [Rhodovastum atsumiense]|uniref:Acetyltransferase component of pyruvate dehydrogenase complex n=1 Tax=Rhodovastum atsumiense TaxID=504468 RepID=A0A5M6J4Y0_9PROT|nr:pyruvate dehydrogenase complex dihydrolipoamide acetyltransferase [Rhodovastum atsumiense]KAA5614685.1 pyruvate dehydrogenase complex dihydrolipoamide acetyltransferase [Rhodovastum atsumiense]CAH2599783.1 Dihydrolipoyllysine-residue acetyltransferase component of pyruvate dehydrogenase complex [Rhodovastum atsumiense]
MATNILMPALSPTMTEGTLARWLKKEGDSIKAGDVIAEIETDKATMEVEAVDEGVLGRILVGDGTAGVKVNDPIAVLVEAGEEVPAAGAAPAKPSAPSPDVAKPEATTPASVAAPVPAPQRNGHDANQRVFASPLARRMAKQAGIDLSRLTGSGPNGRIVRADIEAASKGGVPAAAPQAAPATAAVPEAAPAAKPAAPVLTAPHRLVPHSTMRKVIARRLTEAKQTVPHFYVSMDITLDALLKLRAELNAKSAKDGPAAFKLSVNDLLIKAAAITLRRIPRVNAAWTDDGVALFDDVDISVAVSIPDGLITPIIRRADQKGLAAISTEMKDLGARAKAGKLKPEEFQGGGFSISNMGMYGVSEFAAIINPPQAAILAVAAGEQRPVVRDGQLAIATVMTCTLSVDHRVVDGALGAEWLAEFRRVVEDPLSLML